MKKPSAGVLAKVAILITLAVALTRVLTLVNSPYLKVGLGFLPVALCGMLYGPVYGMICGAISDVIGTILFPTGDFFIGFTITAALTGLFFGLFLGAEKIGWKRVACVIVTNCLILSLGANTVMISYWYGVSMKALFVTRLPQAVITSVAYAVFLPLLGRLLIPALKKQNLA